MPTSKLAIKIIKIAAVSILKIKIAICLEFTSYVVYNNIYQTIIEYILH